MNDSLPRIAVLGGGITGLTLAWKLAQEGRREVVLLEKERQVGGLAGTIVRNGLRLDLGSHRIHPASDPEALRLIRDLLGKDLLQRARRGSIHIKGRFLKYPPCALDMLSQVGLRRSATYSLDYAAAMAKRVWSISQPRDFESCCIRNVGNSLYQDFYAPYAKKLWGLSPGDISFEPATSRLQKFQLKILLRELLNVCRKEKRGAYYLYPAQAIGQICERLEARLIECGGVVLKNVDLMRFNLRNDKTVESIDFRTEQGTVTNLRTRCVVSTLPIKTLHHAIRFQRENGEPPQYGLKARFLRILYLVTNDKVPHPNETFYFPSPDLIMGRVSEIRKYSPKLNADAAGSVLTIEVPCSEDDPMWSMEDEALYRVCRKELVQTGVMREAKGSQDDYFSVKLDDVYPVPRIGWRLEFKKVFDRLNALENVFLIGRRALFLHCNMDHCIIMALRLAEFLKTGQPKAEWNPISSEFLKFQLKD